VPVSSPEHLETLIHLVRGRRVMLDADLASLYGVTTSNLNKAVRRNASRFPEDFAFRLTPGETAGLRFQFGISNGRGGRRYLPWAFTEEGVAMLSSVLRSQRAVRVNVGIMRAFVRMRDLLPSNQRLARRLDELEESCDARFHHVFAAIRALLGEQAPKPSRRRIGFRTGAGR